MIMSENGPFMSLKVTGTSPCFFYIIFTKGDNFCDFLFASLDDSYSIMWSTKEKNCSWGSKFFWC